jgi:hypothetical protein
MNGRFLRTPIRRAVTDDAPPNRRAGRNHFMSLLVVGFAAWTATQTARYVLAAGAMRFHVESASVFFIAAGLVARVLNDKRPTSAKPTEARERLSAWGVLPWVLLALIVYFPAIWIGFLSDDFVLVDHAVRGEIGLVHPQLFRPIPLLVWGTILRAHAGAVAIHLLNVLLHGNNAYLTTRIIEPYVPTRGAALLAGFVVLTFPLNPEAVVWASGVFDVMATTWVALALLIAREYGLSPSIGRRIALYGCGVGALLSKETAAVLPALLILDMWAAGSRSRTLLTDASCMLAVNVAAGVVRLRAASPLMKQPLSTFMLQRWVFNTFGSSVLPWHANVLAHLAWAPLATALLCVGLVTAYVLQPTLTGCRRAVPAMALWMLVCTLPVITIFGVAPDLQGSRYMYLPGVGWAGLIACFASSENGNRARVAQRVATLVMIAVHVVGLRLHFVPWQKAAALRDHVERLAIADGRMTACQQVSIVNVPDNVEGAYVLRNGIVEAFARDVGIEVSPDAPRDCSFGWNDERGFESLTRPVQ